MSRRPRHCQQRTLHMFRGRCPPAWSCDGGAHTEISNHAHLCEPKTRQDGKSHGWPGLGHTWPGPRPLIGSRYKGMPSPSDGENYVAELRCGTCWTNDSARIRSALVKQPLKRYRTSTRWSRSGWKMVTKAMQQPPTIRLVRKRWQVHLRKGTTGKALSGQGW